MVKISSPLVLLTPCQLSDASQAVELVDDQEIATCSLTNKLIGLAEIETVGIIVETGSGALPLPPPPPHETRKNRTGITMLILNIIKGH
jgi:nitrate reductase NapAB chaperone NapD